MQSLDEQLDIIERALGERMINHAMVVARQWATEVGFGEYMERIESLEKNYAYVFQYYLSTEDPDRDALLNKLTGEAYSIIDDLYAAVRLERGLSPRIQGFNPDNIHSVIQYFSSCIQLRESDYEWLKQSAQNPETQATALLAITAISRSLRECFCLRSAQVLIELLSIDSPLLQTQLLAGCILFFAHYDVRIDYFPNLQEQFEEAIGDGEQAFTILHSLVKETTADMKVSLNDIRSMLQSEELPDDVLSMLDNSVNTDMPDEVMSFRPNSEMEYIKGLMEILPDTWVYDTIVGPQVERQEKMDRAYLLSGKLDRFAEHLEDAEPILMERLTTKEAKAVDFINYAHCCFIRGDRLMAYEYYREARTRCQTAREFFALFRPDRRILVEHGVSVDQVYLMEDQLLRL